MLESRRFNTVENFIKAISPFGDVNSHPFKNYIFRGQGNSKWSLLPSVYRDETEIPYLGIQKGPKSTFGQQREMEWELIVSFIKEVNSNGFHLPNENLIYKILDTLDNTQEVSKILRHEKVWPDQEYLSILALAQHYGLPTRLLDWTNNSLISAYFAAKQCIEEIENGSKVKSLSVFALNSGWSEFKGQSELNEHHHEIYNNYKEDITFGIVRPPTYFNAHLKAQKGLFTCQYEFGNIKHRGFIPVCIKEYVTYINDKNNRESSDNKTLLGLQKLRHRMDGMVLCEFKLPSNKAFELISVLDKYHINASILFPTISGCVETIFDRAKAY